MDCRICGTPDEDKAMVFKGLPYCSEHHRKELEAKVQTNKTRKPRSRQ